VQETMKKVVKAENEKIAVIDSATAAETVDLIVAHRGAEILWAGGSPYFLECR